MRTTRWDNATPVLCNHTRSKKINSRTVLPLDVEILILQLLPVKSLVRFRCVCRSWFDLIKSRSFVDNHLIKQKEANEDGVLLLRRFLQSPRNEDVLSFHHLKSSKLQQMGSNISIPYLEYFMDKAYIPAKVHVLGPCNGIVCMIYEDTVILCNPSLREFKRLPPCPFIPPQTDYYNSKILRRGFGITRTGEFKVVLLRMVTTEYFIERHVLIYTLSANSWTQHKYGATRFPTDSVYDLTNSLSDLFFNGACHWYIISKEDTTPDSCITFDINTLDLKMFGCPGKSCDGSPCFMVINECLALAYKGRLSIKIWVMKEYGVENSWTCQSSIRLHSEVYVSEICLFWKNGDGNGEDNDDDEDRLLVVSNKGVSRTGQLVALNTDGTNGYEVFAEAIGTLKGLLYKESLVGLN